MRRGKRRHRRRTAQRSFAPKKRLLTLDDLPREVPYRLREDVWS